MLELLHRLTQSIICEASDIKLRGFVGGAHSRRTLGLDASVLTVSFVVLILVAR
jgi:hypothetical protein